MVTGEALVELTAVSALMLIAGCVVFGMVVLAAIAERPRRQPRPDPAKLIAAARELARHAGHTHAVAGLAAAAAIEARERLAAAEEAREEAWRAQEAAGAAYQAAWREAQAARAERAGHDVPATVDLQLVNAGDVETVDIDRQRDVSRAALAAYRRGELSVDELREVWRRAGDWDPEQEERQRRVDHLRAEELAARRAYERAAIAARQAAEELWAAEARSQEMAGEARAASAEAHEALLVTQRYAGNGKSKGRKKSRGKR